MASLEHPLEISRVPPPQQIHRTWTQTYAQMIKTCTSLSWFASQTKGRHPCNVALSKPSFQDLQGRLGHSSDRSFPWLSPQAMGHVTSWRWTFFTCNLDSAPMQLALQQCNMQQLDCKRYQKRTGTKRCQPPCCNSDEFINAEWVDLQNSPTRKGHLPVHMKMVDRRVFSLAVAGGRIRNVLALNGEASKRITRHKVLGALEPPNDILPMLLFQSTSMSLPSESICYLLPVPC